MEESVVSCMFDVGADGGSGGLELGESMRIEG